MCPTAAAEAATVEGSGQENTEGAEKLEGDAEVSVSCVTLPLCSLHWCANIHTI